MVTTRKSRLGPLAKNLRRNSTNAEKTLWLHLRSRKMSSFKFRRQQVIGPYIVDFVCFEAKLVIEVDGGQHATAKNEDMVRDSWLESRGFRVLRFWNNEVLENIDGVAEVIARNLASMAPLPLP
ncbi:MAG: endonuclease domain-containing protein [Syntrophobacteraceae bacterium]